MNNWAASSQRYYETSVTTSSPEKLVVMLYQGAIRFLKQAIVDIENHDIKGKNQSVTRALAIVNELQSTLDMTNGKEIAAELNRLYRYVREAIINGSMKLETKPIMTAVKVMSTLLEAWEVVASGTQESTETFPAYAAAQEYTGARIQLHG